MMEHRHSVWETVAEHALNHLAVGNKQESSNETSKLHPTQIKGLLEGSWLNEPSVSSQKCITVKELEGYTQVGHSHTKNARCLQQHSTPRNLVGKTGLKPTTNAKSFLVAWLTTSPILPCKDEEGKRHVPTTGEDKLYLEDDTGTVQCQVAVCHWDWLNQALLIPCWNVIPGADARVQRSVEICPRCTPVVISSVSPEPHTVPQQQQTKSVAAAAQLLHSHDSSKGRVNQITITGTVVCKSPIISIHNKPLFFFKLACDVSGSSSVSLLAKGSNLAFLYSALPMYSTCSVSHLTPTTILKGTRKPYHVFLCRKETAVFDVQRNCGDCQHKNSITGTVTKCIDATSGIYELDGKMRLYLCYQMDDTASYQVLRVGCVVTIHNAHHQLRMGKPTMPCVVCCMQSTLTVQTFSPLDTGPKKSLTPSLSGMVRLLLKYNLTISQLDWLSSVFTQLERKFTPTFIRQKSLHAILLRLFTTPSVISKKPLLSGRKRNIYEEFLRPSHSCLASKGSGDEQPPPWQFPVMAELFSSVKKCLEQPSKPRCMVETSSSSILGPSEWHSGVVESTNLSPPMILVGYLRLSPATGQVQLRDQTGTVDCVIANICKSLRPTDTLTHPTPSLDARHPNECRPPKDCPSEVAPPTERKCSLSTCPHIHTWCLGHLIRVEGFLIVQEALPLSCGGRPLKPSQTSHTNNKREFDSLRGHHEFVSFSMQTVECLNCSNSVRSSSNLAKELQDKIQNEDEVRTCTASTISSCDHHCRIQSSSTNSSPSNTSTVKANIKPALQTDCLCYYSKDNLFLLLTKSQLLNSARGSLLFIFQVAFLHRFSSEESGALAREVGHEYPLTRPVLVSFEGDSVRWYHTLHPGFVFRMKGEVRAVSKQEFLSMTSLSSDQLKSEDHDTFLTASHGATLDQIKESSLPEHNLQQLQTAQCRYRDLLHVSSVQDVTADG
ncbi:uncharacterized protein LOC119746226 [Patiria miniata]|uniref:CST complex subunit CTC1 n=1 Tax=Patiria miniata TaxID=46514 RepID=A0A914BTN6_PATMI|nr:uncharacterized protein LOC119746226 [Patiria miniata]